MEGWHNQRLRVRYEETDTMRVVYYAKYLVWMEVGRVSLLRDIGLAYGDWEKRGLAIPVVQAHADYRASARFDDEILVRTRIARVGNKSIRFENEIYKLPAMQLLCTGHTVHALTRSDGKSVSFPGTLKRKLTSS
ncbi:MAG: acyl-CoA thioesterase [Thaumarchaeota archaeon]|nr:acyl-CoA thioesterase [Nitrososphaerota archaeon]